MKRILLVGAAPLLLVAGSPAPEKQGADGIGICLRTPMAYPSNPGEVLMMRATLAPGERSPWHRHPYGVLAYIVQGEMELHDSGGGVRRYRSGDCYVETELPHQGVSVGTEPAIVLAIYLAVPGAPLVASAP